MENVELVQFGTEWCGPCRMARAYIAENFDEDLINYTYVGIDDLKNISEKHTKIMNELQPRSIPLFAVLNGPEVVYTFKGFDMAEINKYAEYAVRKSTNEIVESISEEEMARIQAMYDAVEDGEDDIEFLMGFDLPSNGQTFEEDTFENIEFLSEDDFDISFEEDDDLDLDDDDPDA